MKINKRMMAPPYNRAHSTPSMNSGNMPPQQPPPPQMSHNQPSANHMHVRNRGLKDNLSMSSSALPRLSTSYIFFICLFFEKYAHLW